MIHSKIKSVMKWTPGQKHCFSEEPPLSQAPQSNYCGRIRRRSRCSNHSRLSQLLIIFSPNQIKQDHLRMNNSTGSNNHLRKDINRKQTFSFRHCPNNLTPPPLTQIRATFFSDIKIQDLKVNVGRGGKYINNLKNS